MVIVHSYVSLQGGTPGFWMFCVCKMKSMSTELWRLPQQNLLARLMFDQVNEVNIIKHYPLVNVYITMDNHHS
jgi:hypothetical protein